MKKHVVTASLLAGLSLISGSAFAQTGSIGVNGTRVDTDFGDADAYGVDGDVIFQNGGGWSTLLSASIADVDGGDTITSAGGHLINSNGGSAWGLFVGLADDGTSSTWTAGAEYAMFFDSSTLGFNVNYSNDDDADVDAYGVSAAYNIFASDNLRFDINGTFGRAESSGIDLDVNSVGAGVEWRFDNSPFSIGAGYSRIGGDLGDADIVGVSFRWNFGDNTLKAANHSGEVFTGLGSALPSL